MALKVVGSNPIIHPIKITPIHADGCYFYALNGIRKAGTSAHTGVKSVRWTLFRPWESPSKPGRIRYGCGSALKMIRSARRQHNNIASPWRATATAGAASPWRADPEADTYQGIGFFDIRAVQRAVERFSSKIWSTYIIILYKNGARGCPNLQKF